MRREVLHTDFLTPPILEEAMAAIKKLVDVNAVPNGGYPEVNFSEPDARPTCGLKGLSRDEV